MWVSLPKVAWNMNLASLRASGREGKKKDAQIRNESLQSNLKSDLPSFCQILSTGRWRHEVKGILKRKRLHKVWIPRVRQHLGCLPHLSETCPTVTTVTLASLLKYELQEKLNQPSALIEQTHRILRAHELYNPSTTSFNLSKVHQHVDNNDM